MSICRIKLTSKTTVSCRFFFFFFRIKAPTKYHVSKAVMKFNLVAKFNENRKTSFMTSFITLGQHLHYTEILKAQLITLKNTCHQNVLTFTEKKYSNNFSKRHCRNLTSTSRPFFVHKFINN